MTPSQLENIYSFLGFANLVCSGVGKRRWMGTVLGKNNSVLQVRAETCLHGDGAKIISTHTFHKPMVVLPLNNLNCLPVFHSV